MVLSWLHFFTFGWGVPVFAYVLLQMCALFSVRGPSRAGLWVAAPVMVAVIGHMFWAYHQDSNLWPMTMLMVTPGCVLAVVVLWAVAVVRDRHWKSLIPFFCACVAAVLLGGMSTHGVDILWRRKSIDLAALLVACGVATGEAVRLWRRRRTSGCS